MTELRYLGFRPKTVGADKGYHTADFIKGMRDQKIVPHPALKNGQKTLRVLLTSAHTISQRIRKSRYRGVERTHAQGQYVTATWNLVRMAKLMREDPPQTRWVRPPRKCRAARQNAAVAAR